jgi:hypothetical protein
MTDPTPTAPQAASDPMNTVLSRVATLESALVKLTSNIDPTLGSRVSNLETTAGAILNSHLPAIRSDIASLSAVHAALDEVPGVSAFEEGFKTKIAEWFGARIDALENWASNLGQPAHMAFTKPKPPEPAEQADSAKSAA